MTEKQSKATLQSTTMSVCTRYVGKKIKIIGEGFNFFLFGKGYVPWKDVKDRNQLPKKDSQFACMLWIRLGLALLITRFIVIDFSDCYLPLLLEAVSNSPWFVWLSPFWKWCEFDLSHDQFVLRILLSAAFTYWVAVLICFSLDVILPQKMKRSMKMQPDAPDLGWRINLEIFLVTSVNQFFTMFVLITSWFVFKERHHSAWPNSPHASMAEFNWMDELVKYWFQQIFLDVTHHFSHLWLHTPWAYRHFHKMHHGITAPTAFASLYVHPVEQLISAIPGIFVGPLLTNCHPYMAYFWVTECILEAIFHHSGYKFLAAEYHDDHHHYSVVNYGFGLKLWDQIFGTANKESPSTDIMLSTQLVLQFAKNKISEILKFFYALRVGGVSA